MIVNILFALMLLIVAILTRPDLLSAGRKIGVTPITNLVLQRGIGFLLMLPFLISALINAPFWFSLTPAAGWGTAGIGLSVPFVARYLASIDQNHAQIATYEGLRLSKPIGLLYLGVTILYMTAYEILLRGTLLYWLGERFSWPVAILINTCIYALMHLIKNTREALMCIPFGVFLCLLTLWTQSIWPAAIFHLAMALGFEITYGGRAKTI